MTRFLGSITTLVFIFFFSIASAQQPLQQLNVDTTGLKPEQVKALSELAGQLRREPENTLANLTLQNTTPDRVSEWANAGEAAGKAVSSFTKEIGIAADQFLKTDIGRSSYYIVVWKLGGDKIAASLINTIMSILLVTVMLTFWWMLTRRFVFGERRVMKKDYHQNPLLRFLGFNKKELSIEKDDEWMKAWSPDSQYWLMWWSRVFSCGLLILIVLIFWPQVSF